MIRRRNVCVLFSVPLLSSPASSKRKKYVGLNTSAAPVIKKTAKEYVKVGN